MPRPKSSASPSPRGLLISFEGSEGCGKSTQISLLSEWLEERKREVIVTREPGGTPLGEEIRHLLKHSSAGLDMTPETELLLFAASRAQLVRKVILPAVEAGKIVLCDRFLDSTTVYQGVGRKLATGPVQVINNFAVGELLPDLTFVIDIPAEEGFKRIKRRASDLPDRMESENIRFYQLIRDGYLELARSMPHRFVVIDGLRTREEVQNDIRAELEQRFAP